MNDSELTEKVMEEVLDMDFLTLLEAAKSFQKDTTVPVWTMENQKDPKALNALIDFVSEETFIAYLEMYEGLYL